MKDEKSYKLYLAGIISESQYYENTSVVTLKANDGKLYIPYDVIVDSEKKKWHKGEDVILVHRYSAGDYDTINWPNYDAEQLRSTLYDAREEGLMPTVSFVMLPDGSKFDID